MTAHDIENLIPYLRSRINPAYAMQRGTDSEERRVCVEALEAQRAEIERLTAEREALRASVMQQDRRIAQAAGAHPAPCARRCESMAFEIEIRNLRGRVQTLEGHRGALMWLLWHHQGDASPVGQKIRFALGIGAHETLTETQLEDAKWWAEAYAYKEATNG